MPWLHRTEEVTEIKGCDIKWEMDLLKTRMKAIRKVEIQVPREKHITGHCCC